MACLFLVSMLDSVCWCLPHLRVHALGYAFALKELLVSRGARLFVTANAFAGTLLGRRVEAMLQSLP